MEQADGSDHELLLISRQPSPHPSDVSMDNEIHEPLSSPKRIQTSPYQSIPSSDQQDVDDKADDKEDDDPESEAAVAATSEDARQSTDDGEGLQQTRSEPLLRPEKFPPWSKKGLKARWTIVVTALVMWSLLIVQTVFLAILRPQQYGLHTVAQGIENREWKIQSFLYVTLGFNALSTIVIYISDYIRKCLVAPTTWDLRTPSMTVGYQSYHNWSLVGWKRQMLWSILGFTSLPIHLLYNAMLIQMVPAFDAYTVLVHQSFFTGASFNVSSLSPAQFADQRGCPVPFGSEYPQAWPALAALQSLLEQAQQFPQSWTNMTEEDCRQIYAGEVYRSFRTAIMVTNWTNPVFDNNSALTLAAIAGEPINENRLVAMCPAAYLAATNGSFIPKTTPFVGLFPTDTVWDCLGPSLNTGDCSDINYEEVISSFDMCYDYRPEDPPVWNSSLALSLDYCLSEPVLSNSVRWVFVPAIAVVMVFILALKACAVTLTYFVIPGDLVLERDPKYPGMKATLARSNLMYGWWISGFCWFMLTFALYAWMTALEWTGTIKYNPGVAPSSVDDQTWLWGILIWANIIHVLIAQRAVIENNYFDSAIKESHQLYTLFMATWVTFLHQLASLWIRVTLLDKFDLNSIQGAGPISVTGILDSFDIINGFSLKLSANSSYHAGGAMQRFYVTIMWFLPLMGSALIQFILFWFWLGIGKISSKVQRKWADSTAGKAIKKFLKRAWESLRQCFRHSSRESQRNRRRSEYQNVPESSNLEQTALP